jgi:hypothetical protein
MCGGGGLARKINPTETQGMPPSKQKQSHESSSKWTDVRDSAIERTVEERIEATVKAALEAKLAAQERRLELRRAL